MSVFLPSIGGCVDIFEKVDDFGDEEEGQLETLGLLYSPKNFA
jgi:hypothetical protein